MRVGVQIKDLQSLDPRSVLGWVNRQKLRTSSMPDFRHADPREDNGLGLPSRLGGDELGRKRQPYAGDQNQSGHGDCGQAGKGMEHVWLGGGGHLLWDGVYRVGGTG